VQAMAGGFGAAANQAMQGDLGGQLPVNAQTIPAPPANHYVAIIQPVPGNPVMSVMQAPIRLFRHLSAMKDELIATKNLSEAESLVNGLKFDHYAEHVCAVQYKGIPICNPALSENDPERLPYQKIITDICEQYKIPDNSKTQLLNAKLCDESSLLNFDIQFGVGQPGVFYYGKFMATNIENKIDFCFMFYRLTFKIAPDVIEHTYAKKFLWFTVGSYKTLETKEVGLNQKQLEDFQNYFRLRIFELLGGELKGLADTEPL
jgi:hypothetical protein